MLALDQSRCPETMSRPGSFQFIESDNQKEARLNEEAIFQITAFVATTKIETAIFNSKITFTIFSKQRTVSVVYIWLKEQFRKVSLEGKKGAMTKKEWRKRMPSGDTMWVKESAKQKTGRKQRWKADSRQWQSAGRVFSSPRFCLQEVLLGRQMVAFTEELFIAFSQSL